MSDKLIVGRIVLPAVVGGVPMAPIPPHEQRRQDSLPRDIIKAIAEDIGRDTVAYVDVMYPEAIKATSSTFKLSLRNHIYNQIMASVDLDDVDKIRARLKERAAWRKKWVDTYRNMRRKERQSPQADDGK